MLSARSPARQVADGSQARIQGRLVVLPSRCVLLGNARQHCPNFEVLDYPSWLSTRPLVALRFASRPRQPIGNTTDRFVGCACAKADTACPNLSTHVLRVPLAPSVPIGQADGDVLAVAGTAIKIVRLSSDGSKPHILKKLSGHPITVRPTCAQCGTAAVARSEPAPPAL